MARFQHSRKELIKKAILTKAFEDLVIARRYSTSLENVKILKIELKQEGKLK